MKKKTKKRKQITKKLQRGTVGNFFVFGVLALLIILGITAVGGLPSSSAPVSGTVVKIITPTPDTSHNDKTLQLETFGFTTLAPTVIAQKPTLPANIVPTQPAKPQPTSNKPVCTHNDDGVVVSPACQCIHDTLTCISTTKYIIYHSDGSIISDCRNGGPNCRTQVCGKAPYKNMGNYCILKPVIYLYPTVPTYVNVQVVTSGSITVSNPFYPPGGWKHVLAYPDGSLEYQNQKYTELFYESSVNTFQKPHQGFVIPKDKLAENLDALLSKLGLIGSEKKEFISFWQPRLEALNSPYIFFSVLSTSAKGTVDHVEISPKPDTQIQFVAYFKPIATSTYGSALKLPPTPKRVGFTSVEWGGVIDNKVYSTENEAIN